jgi:hypothetical protein
MPSIAEALNPVGQLEDLCRILLLALVFRNLRRPPHRRVTGDQGNHQQDRRHHGGTASLRLVAAKAIKKVCLMSPAADPAKSD